MVITLYYGQLLARGLFFTLFYWLTALRRIWKDYEELADDARYTL